MSKMSKQRMLSLLAAAILLTTGSAAYAQSGKLEQCANGSASSPRQCTGSNWIGGHITKKNGHYAEGQSVPFRLVMGGLQPGTTYVVGLQWDTTEGGRHAYDYLTDYNRTEFFGNNPCSGVPNCGAFPQIFFVPQDPDVASAGVAQVPGFFTLFGGSITGVTGYTPVGSFDRRSSSTIHITFTASTTTPVLAWGGHLASAADWGPENSASYIPGASFHVRAYAINGKNPGSGERGISGVIRP